MGVETGILRVGGAISGKTVGSGDDQIPIPAVFRFGVSDVSAKNAGRTQDGTMHKMKIGECYTIELEWRYLTIDQAKRVLQPFQPEYVPVLFLNPINGEAEERTFYVGDRAAPLYNGALGLWESISFKIIERYVH